MTLLGETLDPWLEELRRADYAAATVARYASAARRFLAWYEEEERRPPTLAGLTPIALVGYRAALQQQQATSTTNVHLAALRAWCSWLFDEGWLEEDPAVRLKSVRQVERDAPEPLSHTAVNALLRAAAGSRHGKRDYAMLQMMLQTGMRLGECQALRWGDLSLRERTGTVLIRAGKGNKARTVPLNGSVRTALVDYLAPFLECEATAAAVAEPWGKLTEVDGKRPLWPSQKGGQLGATGIWRAYKGIAADCAARDLAPADTTPHDLRHTFAHRYLEEHPGDLVGLARLLGHQSLDTTKIYTQPTVEQLARRVDAMPLNAYG
jgi:site-specific recombinase XerD